MTAGEQWFVSIGDDKVYETDEEGLLAWAREGRVRPDHQVRSSVLDWIQARLALPLRAFFENREAQFFMTTETVLSDFRVLRRIEVISAECAFGMNLFRDLFAGIRDVFGGRSEATQKVLRDARRKCLEELRKEALKLGADAVIGVDLDYSEFSGGGKSMLFLVASGTAVQLECLEQRSPGNEPTPA